MPTESRLPLSREPVPQVTWHAPEGGDGTCMAASPLIAVSVSWAVWHAGTGNKATQDSPRGPGGRRPGAPAGAGRRRSGPAGSPPSDSRVCPRALWNINQLFVQFLQEAALALRVSEEERRPEPSECAQRRPREQTHPEHRAAPPGHLSPGAPACLAPVPGLWVGRGQAQQLWAPGTEAGGD